MTEWGSFQKDIHVWKAGMMPASENTPRKEFERSIEEVTELDKAIADGNPEQIGAEAVDVIIRMIGIATIVGANIDELLGKKIKQTTQEKYPAGVVRANMDLGDTWQQAMAKQKVVWNRKQQLKKQ